MNRMIVRADNIKTITEQIITEQTKTKKKGSRGKSNEHTGTIYIIS